MRVVNWKKHDREMHFPPSMNLATCGGSKKRGIGIKLIRKIATHWKRWELKNKSVEQAERVPEGLKRGFKKVQDKRPARLMR